MIKGTREKAFTLIELLVVIAIISLLSAIVLASLGSSRQKAKISQVLQQIQEMRNAVSIYVADTGVEMINCDLSCTSSTDPFLNSLGVSGWNGPYFPNGVWKLRHPWGGHFSVETYDLYGDGVQRIYFFLDEDAPGTTWSDNSGTIPTDALLAIDKILDDGNLATGNVRGDGLGFLTAPGELVVILSY